MRSSLGGRIAGGRKLRRFMEPEVIWDNVWKKRKDSLMIAVFTFISGILIYIQMIMGWLTNPDGVWMGILFKDGYEWENTLGRIGLEKVNKLKGFFLYPALQTIFCLLLIAAITMLLYEMFGIKQKLWGFILGLLLVCSPSLCDTLTYYYTADAYTLSYFLAVLFVYIVARSKKIWALAIASLLLCISLTLYQAYVGTAITLCLLYLLYLLIKKGEHWKAVLTQGIRFLISGFIGISLYLVLYRIYCIWYRVVPEESRGFASMGKLPLQRIPKLIKQAYIYFGDYYFTNNLYNNSWHLRGKCNLIIFALIIVLVIAFLWKHKSFSVILPSAIGLLLLPLAFMSIVIMAPEVNIRDVTGILMIPHMNFIYLFLLVLIDGEGIGEFVRVSMKWLTLASTVYMVFVLIMYVQVFQNCMRMELNRSYALAQRIVTRIEALPEYHSGELIVGGNAVDGNYPRSFPEMYYVVRGTVATYGYFWDSELGRQSCWVEFLRNYLGVNYYVCNLEDLRAVMASEEYMEMPIFPEEGSVRVIDDKAVVKLSE